MVMLFRAHVSACTDSQPDAAGSNKNDVSGEHAERPQSTDWVSGDPSTSDYDTTGTDTSAWSDDYNGEVAIDVTDVITDIYDAGNNYGVVRPVTLWEGSLERWDSFLSKGVLA